LPTLDTTRKDQVTVEAETVEDALAEISSQLGEDAEIMRAQKVHRGGVGGFFAKEMVQLTARKRRDSAPHRPKPASKGIAGVLERMAQDADAEDGDFRTVLRREMAARPADSGSEGILTDVGWETSPTEPVEPDAAHDGEPAVLQEQLAPAFADEGVDLEPEPVAVGPVLQVAPAFPEVDASEDPAGLLQPIPIVETIDLPVPTPVPIDEEPDHDDPVAGDGPVADGAASPEPATEEVLDAPPGMGSVDWGTTALLRLGMPGPVISAVADLDPSDDLAWIEAIAAAVTPHCGSLHTEDVIVVGPHAERLAEPLGLPLVHAGDMAPYAGSFCAMVGDTSRDREWLEYVQGGRGIHLVIGDEPWQDLLIGEPVAVSWVGETAISDALYLAFTLGATLGYGTVDGFVSTMVRAQPTDVALAVRRIVGRQ
jgi:hypothetical protein